MDEKIEKYIVDIVYATREPEYYQLEKVKHYIALEDLQEPVFH